MTALVREKHQQTLRTAPRYTVVINNDDFTPMEFVIELLMGVFKLSEDDADLLMYLVHYNGKTEVGAFSREIAETRTGQCNARARAHGHPLLCECRQLH